MKKIYFTLGLILLLTSCGYWSNKENTSTTELKTDSITYKKATPPFNYSVTADFPVNGNAALVRNIREWISESLGGTSIEAINSYWNVISFQKVLITSIKKLRIFDYCFFNMMQIFNNSVR